MKQRISAIFTALLTTLLLCVPALATNGVMEYVIDPDDLLEYEEWEALEDQAAEISQSHGCGVYLQFMFDYNDYDYGGIYDTAETLYYGYDFGMGEEKDGIFLLVSYYTRDYALYTYGENAEYAFDVDGIAALEDSFLPYFGEDDWYGGFDAYLVACNEALTRAETGVPNEPPSSSEPASPITGILTTVGVSCVVALLICLVFKGEMKSVRRKSEAKNYAVNGGLQLTERYDRYTHTTESVRRVEKKSSNSGSGGSGSGSSGRLAGLQRDGAGSHRCAVCRQTVGAVPCRSVPCYREEGDITDISAWLHNENPTLAAFWPFLTEIPKEDIIGDHGYLCCIVPLEESIQFTVKNVEWNYEGNGTVPIYSDPLYDCEVGRPFLMYVNYGGVPGLWDDDPDTIIEYEEEYTRIWYPDKEPDGEITYGRDMIFDFAHLYDAGEYVPYLDALDADSEWLLPTDLGLADTTWFSDNGWMLEFHYDENAESGSGDMVLYRPVEGEDGTFLSPYYDGSWWMEDDSLCLGVYEGNCPFPLLISPSGEQLVVMQADDGSVLPFFERGQTIVGLTLSCG